MIWLLARSDWNKRAKEIHTASVDAKTYSDGLKAAFPDRQEAVGLSISRLGSCTTQPVERGTNRAEVSWQSPNRLQQGATLKADSTRFDSFRVRTKNQQVPPDLRSSKLDNF